MKITCISDLHGYYPELPGGDLLIVAGDCTASDRVPQWVSFFEWFAKQQYKKKILVGGNHDGFLSQCIPTVEAKALVGVWEDEGFEYLQDSGTEFEGLKIWGSPWTPEFCNWHFMLPRGKALKEKWDLIPEDTDILVTHGPPYGCMDRVERGMRKSENVGCRQLRKRLRDLKVKLHVFGHIHEGYGERTYDEDTTFVNCSHVNERYEPVNLPITFEFDTGRGE